MTESILTQLAAPFHPSRITWKPGAISGKKDKALALAYADVRAYQNRLDEVCGLDWSVSYTPWGERIICHLTINGVTRSSTGEADSDAERSEIAGTSAEAQAFKRACAMFGLGRYLYQLPALWVEYDASTQRFTEKSKVRLHTLIAQHYQRFLNGQETDMPDGGGDDDGGDAGADDDGGGGVQAGDSTKAEAHLLEQMRSKLDALGRELYGEQWPNVRAHNIKRLAGEGATTLSQPQIDTLINGLKKLKQQRQRQAA
ncbi:MAG: hypothetical protein E6Q97_14230 [Desulfurellales bacterium]|nr:MAG: hypothetical protein E6Q97_14230 [Desulfurellales bacterium]